MKEADISAKDKKYIINGEKIEFYSIHCVFGEDGLFTEKRLTKAYEKLYYQTETLKSPILEAVDPIISLKDLSLILRLCNYDIACNKRKFKRSYFGEDGFDEDKQREIRAVRSQYIIKSDEKSK